MSVAQGKARLVLLLLLEPALARAEGSPLGDTASALPGIVRVGVPGLGPRRVAVAGTAGYGMTESQGAGDGAHHRLGGTAAVGVAPISALELALRFDGRYDLHPDDGQGTHGAGVGDPRFIARFGAAASSSFRVGVEAAAWLPGKDAPSVAFDATTLDAKLLGAYAPEGGPVVGLAAGFRLDQSKNAAPDLARLRSGDRLALGLSDSSAVLAGLGVSYPLSSTELLGEVSADLLVGSKAPGLGKSPMRVDLGVRHHLSRSLALEVLGEVSPSGRPGLAPTDPLVPVEPRFSLMAGLRFRLPFDAEPEPAPGPTGPEQKTPEQKTPVAAAATTGSLRVVVLAEDGTGVPDATVTVKVGEEARPLENAGGTYSAKDLPVGPVAVSVTAEGFAPAEQSVNVTAAESAPTEIRLKALAPSGQLRGLIRSFAGKGISATIHVEPGDGEVKTDGQGAFTLDVPPGDYEVSIRAQGFKEQRRKVHVDENGVTVINAELFEGK
ncbi:MAG TPA: carboxypeptidase regulatory-like domain-containing protein [Polyangiaceae bacterium]|nr:carboxypeptidase regulatory-like domain-containing protein [Polyangiaceae bacterium]